MGAKGKQIVNLVVEELLDDLNRLHVDEWLAAFAYNYRGQVVTGRPAAKNLAGMLLDTTRDELEHQQELAGRIVSLGGKPVAEVNKPVVTNNDEYPTPPIDEKDFEAIVRTVIKAEHGAIEAYNRLAQKTHGRDPITYTLVLHILTEEVEHEDEFECLLS